MTSAISYVPTLQVRQMEIAAVANLPAGTKDRILPCFLLSPWPNAKRLEAATRKILEAYSQRKFLLDIDRRYDGNSPAKAEFTALSSPNNSYARWAAFCQEIENAIPCVPIYSGTLDESVGFAKRHRQEGLSVCLRIERELLTESTELSRTIASISPWLDQECMIILDAGFSKDLVSMETWFSSAIRAIATRASYDIPVVISYTSMIANFFELEDGIRPLPFSNHELLDNIRRRHQNMFPFILGDWGSTRPREPARHMARPLPRIDYPTHSSWVVARNKSGNWDYREAAKNIVNSKHWAGSLGIWGADMISYTAEGNALGIYSPPRVVAARINIHLHRQAYWNEELPTATDLEERFND